MKSMTNEELADLLDQQQVDRTLLNEAAYRLRRIHLDQLLIAAQTVEALHASPVINREVASKVEGIILAAPLSAYKQSSATMSSLASRVLKGDDYTRGDVMSLAASVLSQDETAKKS